MVQLAKRNYGELFEESRKIVVIFGIMVLRHRTVIEEGRCAHERMDNAAIYRVMHTTESSTSFSLLPLMFHLDCTDLSGDYKKWDIAVLSI